MLKNYYQLTKPGIIYGNAITLAAGFFLASRGRIHPLLLLEAFIGLSLVIASGCALNNVWDANIDAKMQRTQNRAMAKKTIAVWSAIIFAAVLGLCGFAGLIYFTNLLTTLAALVGWVVYVCIYTPLKRRTVYATLVGSIAGAAPPVVGYAAAANRLDAGALILFLILALWQMPHFYAIAIRRLDDYAAAGVPVLPVKKGIRAAKIQILIYIALFTVAAAALTFFKFAGYIYLAAAILLGATWLFKGIKGFNAADDKLWAKKMFLFSLVTLMFLCLAMSVEPFIRIWQ